MFPLGFSYTNRYNKKYKIIKFGAKHQIKTDVTLYVLSHYMWNSIIRTHSRSINGIKNSNNYSLRQQPHTAATGALYSKRHTLQQAHSTATGTLYNNRRTLQQQAHSTSTGALYSNRHTLQQQAHSTATGALYSNRHTLPDNNTKYPDATALLLSRHLWW